MEPAMRLSRPSNKSGRKQPALRLTGLQQLLFKLTGIHSPTGGGGAANRFMAKYFEDVGLRATSDEMWHSRATCSAKAADRTVARRRCRMRR